MPAIPIPLALKKSLRLEDRLNMLAPSKDDFKDATVIRRDGSNNLDPVDSSSHLGQLLRQNRKQHINFLFRYDKGWRHGDSIAGCSDQNACLEAF